jgi:hypothetical protein
LLPEETTKPLQKTTPSELETLPNADPTPCDPTATSLSTAAAPR